MAPVGPSVPNGATSKKRKGPPDHSNGGKQHNNKRPKVDHRAKQRDARQLSTQTTSKAFKNGELDIDKFVRAREFEIRALEEGMQRSKTALNRRAFQQVPKELRRRTASHNVKKIPKRLQARGKREMVEDNTPTVTARRRKPTRHMRLRLETAKKLREMGKKRTKADKEKAKAIKITAKPDAEPSTTKPAAPEVEAQKAIAIKTRAPRVKKAVLAQPSRPKAKFRKRQVHKSWLPTHLFHAKRAHMTPPSAPLWRFSLPLTPTAKCYRPTHHASRARGAVAWDTSYTSSIFLEGQERSIIGLLRALGVDESELVGRKGHKWREGLRVLETMVMEREAPHAPIAPVTMIWCAVPRSSEADGVTKNDTRRRKVLLRVHPSGFFQLWEETLRLAKVAKPEIRVEDLRFELGSIEITGPGATEALLSALWPSPKVATPDTKQDNMEIDAKDDNPNGYGNIEQTWKSLSGLTSSALLPPNALLSFEVQDPRLHHPPRTIEVPTTSEAQSKLIELIAQWPVDSAQRPALLLDRNARMAASRALPSQKAINRRKALAPPGQYPKPVDKDPRIPILLHATPSHPSRKHGQSSGGWTLLVPWKAVQPIWYSIMYYPLSTGQQPRFGGQDEIRQLASEAGRPWFPADYPGTNAGWEWEMQERFKRHDQWKRKPKGKRVNWDAVDVGGVKGGELGVGWACDWQRLLTGPPLLQSDGAAMDVDQPEPAGDVSGNAAANKPIEPSPAARPGNLVHLPSTKARMILAAPDSQDNLLSSDANPVVTVHFTLFARGVPQSCARVYRLPSNTSNEKLRAQWLALLPSKASHHTVSKAKTIPPRLPAGAPAHEVQKRLAQSLLQPPRAGGDQYPACPGEEDLIGFVTTGNFNLAEGQGAGVGSILIKRVLEGVTEGGGAARLCVVRNSGESVGRLARWEIV